MNKKVISRKALVTACGSLFLVVILIISGCGSNNSVTTPTPPMTPTILHVRVEVYGDFQCPKCANLFFSVEEELVKLYGNNTIVSIDFRPINGFGDASLLAAEAALCAKDQGKFQEYCNALYTAWQKDGKKAYSEDNLIKAAVNLGLDEQMFSSCLKGGTKETTVELYKKALVNLGETEVPMTYINGHKIKGVQPLQTFVDYINGLLSDMPTPTPAS